MEYYGLYVFLIFTLAFIGVISIIGFPYLFYRVIKNIQFVKSTQFLANHQKPQSIKYGIISVYIFILLGSVLACSYSGLKFVKCLLDIYCYGGKYNSLVNFGVAFIGFGFIYWLLKLVLNFLSKK